MDAVREHADPRETSSRPLSVPGEVLAVLRLALTLRVDTRRLVGRDETIAVLGAAALGLWLLLGRVKMVAPLRLDVSGLTGIAACACAAIALAWLLARVANPPLPVRRTMWLVAGYLPAAAACGWLLNAPVSRSKVIVVAVVFAVHAMLYFFFGLRALAAAPPWRAFGSWLVAVAALVALAQLVPLQAGFWTPQRTAAQVASYQESERRAEALLYSQPERIDAALAAITDPGAPGPNVYFVGFAGFGEQQVFAQEIALAADRVRERYGTSGRSLLLINDFRNLDEHPLASRSALSRVLKGIAARMDRDNDVLFLALSSHGRHDPYLLVSNGALPLEELTPDALAGILGESGIRWKVLVISACYAGAFIERLRDEHTAIITAAAPDKTSFGCNDRRELTYFGEAFYRDALPKAASLRDAFEAAAAAIAARERHEDLVPSDPRAHFGAAMVRKLDELEKNRTTAVRWRPSDSDHTRARPHVLR